MSAVPPAAKAITDERYSSQPTPHEYSWTKVIALQFYNILLLSRKRARTGRHHSNSRDTEEPRQPKVGWKEHNPGKGTRGEAKSTAPGPGPQRKGGQQVRTLNRDALKGVKDTMETEL